MSDLRFELPCGGIMTGKVNDNPTPPDTEISTVAIELPNGKTGYVTIRVPVADAPKG